MRLPTLSQIASPAPDHLKWHTVAGVEASSTDEYVKVGTPPVDELDAAWENPLDRCRLKIDLVRRMSRQSSLEDNYAHVVFAERLEVARAGRQSTTTNIE